MNEGTETDSDADAPAAEYLDGFELPDAWSTQLPEDPLDKTLDELENSSATIHSRENRQSSISEDDEGSNHFEKVFSCVLLAYKRQIKGQSSGSYIARWQVTAHSTTSFIRKVWNLAKEHLNREVVFDVKADGTTSPVWAEHESPSEKEFGKFVLFQSGRRHYALEKLTESSNLLQSWRNKEITVLLHVYSLSVSNRTVWSSVKENLIDPSERDRLGAATTQAVIRLADELRSVHGKHLDAHGMAWSFWANSMLNGPAHLRESLKDHPPQHLAHLFRVKEG